MSDFLTNLAARALGAPTLRPRTRSRFEPEPEASPWIDAPAAVTPRVDAPSESSNHRVVESTRERADDIPTTRPLDDSTPRPRGQEHQPEITPRAHIEHREIWSAAARPPLPKAEALPPHSIQTLRTTERVIERAIEHHDHTTIRVERHEEPSRPVAESPREREEEVASTTRRLEDSTTRKHRYDEQPPRIERRELTITAREPQAVPQRPRIETPAAPEPVIHVSIGRVEVRATAPAATPQRARTRNASMTIEDYAARRNAKGRP